MAQTLARLAGFVKVSERLIAPGTRLVGLNQASSIMGNSHSRTRDRAAARPGRGPGDRSAYGVVLFHTTSAALRAEKVLQRAGLAVKLVPTPREFSSACGMALRFPRAQVEQARAALDAAHVEVSDLCALN